MTRPEIFEVISKVFNVDLRSHQGHMKTVQQGILDGTSKWSAKIAITGAITINDPYLLIPKWIIIFHPQHFMELLKSKSILTFKLLIILTRIIIYICISLE